MVAGLNRKSGTGVAASLMPSLAVDDTRVFSLVYGSGISDRDILDKFDTLMAQYQPRQVSFFGSSMGGDVVLGLAAHTQDLRADYRRALIAASGAAAVRFAGHSVQRHSIRPASDPPALDSSALRNRRAVRSRSGNAASGRAARSPRATPHRHRQPRDDRVGRRRGRRPGSCCSPRTR